jgi:hypothetical protein
MSLFDSPNDMQWQYQVNTFKRGSNETLIGKIVDERGDGNYLDNMFQKYTVELLGWGQKVYSCKVKIDSAGYNGTGNYQSFKAGDGVLIQCKEGQLDDAIIIGSHRLNGDLKQLEVEGQGQKFGEHYKGSAGKTAASSPPSLHPGRITKVEGNVFIGGVNNARTPFEDPTQLGTNEECLDKQPLPGLFKATTKEGVDINYSYGGKLEMTDGNFVVLSSGTTQNKCTKYLEQASRHKKIADHLSSLSKFISSGINNTVEFLDNLDSEEGELKLDQKIKEGKTVSITTETQLSSPVTGKPSTSTKQNDKASDADETKNTTNTTTKQKEDSELEKPEKEKETKYAIKAGTNNYRALKHTQLSEIAAAQAQECNTNNAAYQYSSSLMNNSSPTTLSNSSSSPTQGVGHVDANNYSSRNTENPKPPTEFVGCHSNNYSREKHTLKYLVLHHSAASMEGTINTFQDPGRKASAQYAVGKDGRVVQFVKDDEKAYHVAGQDTGKIGIEIIATKPNEGMTKEQEESLIKLCRFIVSTYKIPLENVRGHNTFMKTECPTWIFPTQSKLSEWANKHLKV